MRERRAIFFSLDALFGLLIILTGIFLITTMYFSQRPHLQTVSTSTDILGVLSEIKVSESSNPYIQELIQTGKITGRSLNNSILEQMGEFWAENKTDLAQNMLMNVTYGYFPDEKNIGFFVEDDLIYMKNASIAMIQIPSRIIVSGISKYKPVKGKLSRAFLGAVPNKPSAKYVYFGGFIGQGNITVFVTGIPSDANISKVYLELDNAMAFDLYINGIECSGSFAPSVGNLTADVWDISRCNSSLSKGSLVKNNFTFVFPIANISTAYIGGGFLRIDYTTGEVEIEPRDSRTFWIPGITGLVNFYSSFYVPGNLSNMSMYLHYFVDLSPEENTTISIIIGNTTAYLEKDVFQEGNVTLLDSYLSSKLNYTRLSTNTVPFRIMVGNLTTGTVLLIMNGSLDAVLLTDISGSMDDPMAGFGTGVVRNCTDPNFLNNDTQKLSVAKCTDKEFVSSVLANFTKNRVGLVTYSTTTERVDQLNNNATYLNAIIDTYATSGATCISCGVYNGTMILLGNTSKQLHSDYWLYTGDYRLTAPPSGWNGPGFDDSSWSNGSIVLGFGSGVTTDISNYTYPDLWENGQDLPQPLDFTSGLNTTANTPGWTNGSGNDGWDILQCPYGCSGTPGSSTKFNADSDDDNQITDAPDPGGVDTDNYLQISIGADNGNSAKPDSGAYGIEFNITQEMYNAIKRGETVNLSFNYYFIDDSLASNEAVWIKAMITNSSNATTYLGSSLDGGYSCGDATNEIFYDNNPNDYSGFFSQDISSWITSPGWYYLDIGAKVCAWGSGENGVFRFDNIMLKMTDRVGDYYFRNYFTLSSVSELIHPRLLVMSDDSAEVYLNANLISNDTAGPHSAGAWNAAVYDINLSFFQTGTNVIAVHLRNNDPQSAKFNLELRTDRSNSSKALLVMSDGGANRCHYPADGEMDSNNWGAGCSLSNADNETITFACYARKYFNYSIYTVAFGTDADVILLNRTACCDSCEHFYKSSNVSELMNIYRDIAEEMLSASYEIVSQTVYVYGNMTPATLYPDSYIRVNYTPLPDPLTFGQFPVHLETPRFRNCTPSVYIQPEFHLVDAKVTSYSGEHWTDLLTVNNNVAFNLSSFSRNYTPLGDPFIVHVPVELFQPGSNSIYLRTGDSPLNSTGCSANSTMLYTVMVNLNSTGSGVLPYSNGCVWRVEFYDGTITVFTVPESPQPTQNCNYTNASISYNPEDSYDAAIYSLLSQLDFDRDGRVDVRFDQSYLTVGTVTIEEVPSLWGPSRVEVRVWQ